MVKVVMGFDPGINECAFVILDKKKGVIEAKLIPNPYNQPGPVKKLEKAMSMCLAVRNTLITVPRVDLAIIEASTGSAGGAVNYNTMSRMALVSGSAFGVCDTKYIEYVAPQTWKLTKDKLENHLLYLDKASDKHKEQLNKFLQKVPKSKQHNILDAFCMALWGLEQ